MFKRLSLELTMAAALAGIAGCTTTDHERALFVDAARRCDQHAQRLITADTQTKETYLEDLKHLQSDLEKNTGAVYIFINGYLEQNGKLEKGFWTYKTNIATKDLAAILSKHTGIEPENSSRIKPDYMKPEFVVKMASRMQRTFKQPPRGRTLSPVEADKEGYVPIPLNQIEAILASSTQSGGGQFTYANKKGVGGQLYTLEKHEQMKRKDPKQGVYDKQAPAYLLLVVPPKK